MHYFFNKKYERVCNEKKSAKIILLFLFVVTTLTVNTSKSFGQNYWSHMFTGGFISQTGEPLWNSQVFAGKIFQDSFKYGPCTFITTQPIYGDSYLYGGSWLGVEWWSWGWGFDTILNPFTSQDRDIFINNPFSIGQVRWMEYRAKWWDQWGVERETEYIPRWTPDPGTFFPNQKVQNAQTFAISIQRTSRVVNNWAFHVFDHPGMTETFF